MAERPKERHRRHLDSLATRLILFVFFSTFMTAVVVSSIAVESTYREVSDSVDQKLQFDAISSQKLLTGWLAERTNELARLPFDAPESLHDAVARTPHFDGVARVDAAGRTVTAAGRELTDPAGISRTPMAGLRALPMVGGRNMVIVEIPVAAGRPDAGRLVGILPGSDIAALGKELASRSRLPVLLVDPVGRIVVGPGSPEATIALDDVAADDGRVTAHYRNYAGEDVLGSALSIGDTGWTVVAEAPFNNLFAPVISMVKRILVIDVCIILLFSILAFKITTAVLRPVENLSDGARRIAQGQLDHEIPEPESNDEIALLTRTFNDMMGELRGNHAEIASANGELLEKNLQLQQANEVLEQLSITDGLTKLHNHRFFQDHLTREIKRVNRVEEPLSMILVDVDDFKSLNDRLGHAAGDELLRRIAALMNACVRESDLVARYGGDEFVILLADTNLEGAQRVAEKIRMGVAENSFIVDESMRPTRTTLSIGAAQFRGTRKRFFSAADQALYRAKAQGKNCVVLADNDD